VRRARQRRDDGRAVIDVRRILNEDPSQKLDPTQLALAPSDPNYLKDIRDP